MRQLLLLLVGTVVLWVPAVSLAGDSSPSLSAKQAAKAEPHARNDAGHPVAMGRAKYGSKESAESHGKNSGDGNHKDSAEGDKQGSAEGHGKEDSTNPAMTCKAMQANDLTHFQTTYGTRPNAFGKCVAKQARNKKG
jgi:hypothetical protein